MLRSGLTVHQHELLAVRNPFSEISAFSCLKMSGGKTKGCWERDRIVGKYLGKSRDYQFYRLLLLGIIWVNVGRERGVGKEASFLGNIWVKVGISGSEFFQCFLIPDQNPKSMFFKTNNMALIFYPD